MSFLNTENKEYVSENNYQNVGHLKTCLCLVLLAVYIVLKNDVSVS